MEEMNMKKKEYMQPEMQVIEIDFEQQILAGSVTSVTTTGLDDDLILPSEDQSGNPWEIAW
jgi:hypothetical protein